MSDLIKMCQKAIKSQGFNIYKDALEKIGFQTEVLSFAKDGKTIKNLYAKMGSGFPHLLFNGHYDVVPAGDESLWKHPPFEAVIEGDVLYGRGIVDMKGGIVCFIEAIKEFLQTNKPKGSISFIISGDEEEPVVDGTKKCLELLTQRGEVFDFCIVGEPSSPDFVGQDFKIGRRGDCFIKIKSIGIQGHSAYPHLADNPIHNLVDLLAKLQNTSLDNGNDYFDASTLQVTTFDVGNVASNVIPATATAQIDIRFNSEHSPSSIIAYIKDVASKHKGSFEIHPIVAEDSFLTNANKDVDLFVKVVSSITGSKPNPSTSGGTSDARFVKDYCPVIEFGLTNQTIHKINECAKTSDIILLKEIYKEFLFKYFN